MMRVWGWCVRAWTLVQRVPVAVQVVAAAATVLTSVAVWHVHMVDAAYAKGRADVLAGARYDSTVAATILAASSAATAHTDTIVRTVQRIVRRVDSIVVPDTVRVRFPVVDTLVVESKALVVAVDSLTRTLATERQATTLLVSTLQQSVTDARLVAARLAAENAALSKRPTRMKALALGLLSAGAGYAAGAR